MQISCTDAMVPGTTYTQKAANLAKWGYDSIAVFADRAAWSDKLFNELQGLEKNTGVKVCEFVFTGDIYGHLMDKKNGTYKKARAMYKETLDVCKALGAVTEMEFEYCIQDPMPLFSPYAQMGKELEEEFLGVIKELSQGIENTNANLLIEPINRYESRYLNMLQDCKKIIQKFDNPNLGLLPDFFHMSIEEIDLPASIKNAGTLIKHVHLGDSNRLLPGYGRTDWATSIKALHEAGFTGTMNLECGVPGEPEVLLPITAQYLKKLIMTVEGE